MNQPNARLDYRLDLDLAANREWVRGTIAKIRADRNSDVWPRVLQDALHRRRELIAALAA